MIYYFSGQPLFISGAIAIDSGCCCGCDLCDDTGSYGISGDSGVVIQDDIQVTISGSCDSGCSGAAGVYSFSEKIEDTSGCTFLFFEPFNFPEGNMPLSIIVRSSGTYGRLSFADSCIITETNLITATCNKTTKKITVTGSLTGSGETGGECSDYQCSGCTFYLTTI